MTVEAILAELERLKDFVNDPTKVTIDNLKAAVAALPIYRHDNAASEPEPEPQSKSEESFEPLNTQEPEPKKRRPYKRHKVK